MSRRRFPRTRRRSPFIAPLASAALLALAPAALADESTWIGSNQGAWSNPANWSGPIPNAIDQTATFRDLGVGGQFIKVDGLFTLGSLVIDSEHIPILDATAAGSGLIFSHTAGPASITVNRLIAGTPAIWGPVQLASDLDVNDAAGRGMGFSGSISGPGGITVSRGHLGLSGDNSYAGLTVIRQGASLYANGPTTLGSPDVGTIVDGGRLELSSLTNEPITADRGASVVLYARDVYQNTFKLGSASLEVGESADGTPTTIANALHFTGGRAILLTDSRSPLVIAGGTIGSGDLELRGTRYPFGRVRINGTLAHSGNVIVSAGTFELNQAPNFTGYLEVGSPFDFATANINTDATIADLRLTGGDLNIATGKTLTVSADTINLSSGTITGALDAKSITKITAGTLTLNDLAGKFNGPITTNEGILLAAASSLAASPAGITIAPKNAVAVLSGTYAGPIALKNASGYGFGALIADTTSLTHTGPLALGDIGSSVGAISSATLTLAGPISGGSLTVASPSVGSGTVVIAGNANTYTGFTRVERNATLSLREKAALITTSEIQIAGTLEIAQDATEVPDRIGDSIPISMEGGRLRFVTKTPETLGPLTASKLTNIINAPTDPAATVTFASLTRKPGAVLRAIVPQPGTVRFTSPPQLVNGILGGWASTTPDLAAIDFVTLDGNRLVPYTNYATDLNSAEPSHNVQSMGDLTSDRTINALKATGDINLLGHTLTINSGGVILNGDALSNGTIVPGAGSGGELILHSPITMGGPQIAANIADGPAGKTTLIISGGATLSGTNTHTGGTIIDQGVVTIANSAALPVRGDVLLADAALSLAGVPADSPHTLGKVTMIGSGSVVTGGPVDASAWEVEGGRISALLSGNGSLSKSGPFTLTLAGVTEGYGGTIDIRGGAVVAGNHALGTAPIRLGAGGILYGPRGGESYDNPIELAGGTLVDGVYTGNIVVTAPSMVTSHPFQESFGLQFEGPVTIHRGASLTINSYSNPYFLADLTVDGELASSSGLALVFGISGKQVLSGSGVIHGTAILRNGATVSPGKSPGTLTLDEMDWSGGGKYRWEIAKALGQAGADWDLVRLKGLGISASADNPFEIDLISLGPDGAPGLLADFDPTQTYSWLVASADNSLGFSPDAFRIDASQFANELAGGHFAIAQSSQDIVLTFTPVPEPALIILPFAAVLLLKRRSK